MSKKDIKAEITARLEKAGNAPLEVPLGPHLAGALVAGARPGWLALGRLEAAFLRDRLDEIPIEKPVYVCGLARSGTTILLQTLERTGAFATHRYRDYPFIDVPVVWNRWLDFSARQTFERRERAHLDTLRVTPESPEAVEEMVWMAHFPAAHDPARPSVLGQKAENPGFEDDYRAHLRKIMLVRGKRRYLAKGNYNLTRIGYLHKLFPDAKFIVPVRDPAAHITSLYKQHVLFSRVERENPRALKYLQRAGHFEFGLDRRPINTGDDEALSQVRRAWAGGDEITGWALYWEMLHRWLLQTLAADRALAKSVHLVSFEALCRNPGTVLKRLFAACGVSLKPDRARQLAVAIKTPSYFKAELDAKEKSIIRTITAKTWGEIQSLARG